MWTINTGGGVPSAEKLHKRDGEEHLTLGEAAAGPPVSLGSRSRWMFEVISLKSSAICWCAPIVVSSTKVTSRLWSNLWLVLADILVDKLQTGVVASSKRSLNGDGESKFI